VRLLAEWESRNAEAAVQLDATRRALAAEATEARMRAQREIDQAREEVRKSEVARRTKGEEGGMMLKEREV